MKLSDDQKSVFEKYVNGENIFITGPGGCGKSEIIRYIYKDACDKKKNIQVCALTGCAATLLECNAQTIHSWSGVGIDTNDYDKIMKRIAKMYKFKKKWFDVEILIIDEISMMSLELFDILNMMAKQLRKKNQHFGNIQIIASGDFYQLPPINSNQFCFESTDWKEIFGANQIELKTIFRQKDSKYKKMLNQIRKGKLYKNSYNLLCTRMNVSTNGNEITPVMLHSNKQKVETLNNNELKNIREEEMIYNSDIEIVKDSLKTLDDTPNDTNTKLSKTEIEFEKTKLSQNSGFYNKLILKKGAKVMSTVNYAETFGTENPIYNGCQGVVIDFTSDGFPIVKFSNGVIKTIICHSWVSDKFNCLIVKQIPLILAWAITIHKSQGLSLDTAVLYIGDDIFEEGQIYVAISRVKCLEGLYLNEFNHTKIKANKKVIDFYDTLAI